MKTNRHSDSNKKYNDMELTVKLKYRLLLLFRYNVKIIKCCFKINKVLALKTKWDKLKKSKKAEILLAINRALVKKAFLQQFVIHFGIQNKSEFQVFLIGTLNSIKFKILGQLI